MIKTIFLGAMLSLTAFAKLSQAADVQGQKFDSLFAESQKQNVPVTKGQDPHDGMMESPGGSSDPHAGGVDPHSDAAMGSMLPNTGSAHPLSLKKISALEAVPVMHEGRLKPMITYARNMLLQFSGITHYEKYSAVQVMAQILFTPESVGDFKLFLINNPDVPQALGVTADKHRRYSFNMLEKSLPKMEELAQKASTIEEEKRDLVQKEILRTFQNLVEFVNLSRTFSYALPNPIYTLHLPETKNELGLTPHDSIFSFWDLMSSAQAIAKVLENIGTRPDSLRSPMEKEIISLSQSMYYNSQTLHASPFHIFPSAAAAQNGGPGFASPAELLVSPEQMQSYHVEIAAWAAAVKAYRNANQNDFDTNIKSYLTAMDTRAYEPLSHTQFNLEILYQKVEPFFWSLVAYWISLLAIFTFFLLRKKWLYQISVYVFLAGYFFHLAAIVSRILIMHRPPVTSLYETFPFVSAVSILAALFIERLNRKKDSIGIGLLCASLLGMILLSIANRYAAEGDTLHMLVAVLNSNFWLSTHVVCVTIGYSACLLAGAIGHIWLIRAAIKGGKEKSERLKEISKMVYGTLCFGLLFSFIGTVLGGIWADQSWGRFWGWDPKENGALLIVLWCIILLHAKQWGKIKNFGLAQGAVFGAIVVSLAWFGVNLLNVGLHSYGFTTGAATKLFSFIGGEILFMVVTALFYYREQSSLKAKT